MRLNEINHLAQKSNVTVCSLNDFKSIVSSLGINDGNVEKYVGKYCFIEIGSGWGRIEAETPIAPAEFDSNGNEYDAQGFYSQGQWYFSNEHPNVIKLEFDDNQKFNNKKDNTMTAVKLRPEETRGGVKGTTFYYKGGQDFTTEIANRLKTFVDNNLSYGNNVHFIIHCKQGKSRSAAIGSYVARKINQFTDEFLSEYDDEENGVSQFNMGVGRKGEPKYPHQNVMNRMGDLEGWNKSKDVKDQWWYNTIRQHPKTGYNDKRKEWEMQRAEKNKVAENNNRNMKKVRLTESKLRGMIREAVKNQINEISAGLAQNAANKAYSMGREGFNQYDEPNTIPAGSPHWKKFMQGERFQKYVNNIFDYDKGNYIYYPNGDDSLMVVRNANGEDLTKPCTSLNDLEREYKSVKMHESKLRNTIQEAVKSVLSESDYMDDGNLEPQYSKNPETMWTYGQSVINPSAVAGLDPHSMRHSGKGNKRADNAASWDYFDAVRDGADMTMRDRAEAEYKNRSENLKDDPMPRKAFVNGRTIDDKRADLKQYLDTLSKKDDEIRKYEKQANTRPLHRKGSLNREA